MRDGLVPQITVGTGLFTFTLNQTSPYPSTGLKAGLTSGISCQLADFIGVPYRIRTGVAAVRGGYLTDLWTAANAHE
jgi:hypothetical protein